VLAGIDIGVGVDGAVVVVVSSTCARSEDDDESPADGDLIY